MQSSNKPVPPFAKALITDFGSRHVKGVVVTRVLVATWLVLLGTFFCVTGRWWGALLFVPAAINVSLVYLSPRWRLALDAEKNAESYR